MVIASISLAMVAAWCPAPARADPINTTVSNPGPLVTDVRKLSSAKKSAVKLADYIRRNATHRRLIDGKIVLDYRKAKAYDKGHDTFRRKFAAGLQITGGIITNISSTEQAKVNSYKPSKASIYRKLPKDVFGNPYCRGENRYVEKSNLHWRNYIDSCKTAALIAVMGASSMVAGAVAGLFPPAAPYATMVMVVLGLGALYLVYLADTSAVQAVFIRYYYYLLSAGRQ